jgi:cytochrome c556
MKIVRWAIYFMLTGIAGGAEIGSSQNTSPTELIKNRIANFHKIGEAFKGIRDQLRATEPAVSTIQEFAGRIESLGSQIPTWFPPGTDAHAQDGDGASRPNSSANSERDDGKTRAKDEIWTERTAFEAAHKRFLSEAQKLNEVAKTGDRAGLTKQYEVLGAACKNCHNTFRR